MSGVLFRLPVELIGAAALIELLQPHLTNLDAPVSSRVTPEQVAAVSGTPLPQGTVH
jgi:hypothetical protein